jgi:hypothetical protein
MAALSTLALLVQRKIAQSVTSAAATVAVVMVADHSVSVAGSLLPDHIKIPRL